MNNKTETQRLSNAVTALASTILEIVNEKVRLAIETRATLATVTIPNQAGQTAWAGWVMKKEVADHFKISLRTLHAWMRKGWVPYMKTGRSVRFKLSHVDAAMKRCNLIDYPG